MNDEIITLFNNIKHGHGGGHIYKYGDNGQFGFGSGGGTKSGKGKGYGYGFSNGCGYGNQEDYYRGYINPPGYYSYGDGDHNGFYAISNNPRKRRIK